MSLPVCPACVLWTRLERPGRLRPQAVLSHVGGQHFRVLVLMVVEKRSAEEAWRKWKPGANDNGADVPRPSLRRMGAVLRAALRELVALWSLDQDRAA